MRGPWLGVLLAGCSGAGALEIQVAAPAGADKVELFAGILDPTTEAIRPELYGAPFETTWWQRDRDLERDIQALDPGATDQKLTYAFQAGADADSLEALVAVAYLGGAPVAAGTWLNEIDIPTGEIHRYSIPLTTFDTLPRTSPGGAAVGLQLWGPGEDKHACVHVAGAEGIPDALITLKDDADCDGYLDPAADDTSKECVRHEFNSRSPITRDRLRCVKPAAVVRPFSVVDVCSLGGAACVDGVGPNPLGCEPTGWCAPSGLCAACPAGSELDCGGMYDLAIKNVTHLECPIDIVFPSNVPTICTNDVTLSFPDGFGPLSCASTPKLRDPKQPGWVDELSYNSGATKIKVSVVDATTCAFKINSMGVPLTDGGAPRSIATLLTVPLALPSQVGRGVALPVVFKPRPAANGICPEREVCYDIAATGDTMHACLSSPPDPDTEVPAD